MGLKKGQSVKEMQTESAAVAEDIPFENKPVEEAAAPAQQLSTAQPVQLPAASAPAPIPAGEMMHTLAERGHMALDDTWRAFPVISMKAGAFSTNDKVKLGTAFRIQISSSRFKFMLNKLDQNGNELPENEQDAVYSYDTTQLVGAKIDENGKQFALTQQEWVNAGYSASRMKTYTELQGQLVDGELAGTFVIVSISPTSVGAYASFMYKEWSNDQSSPDEFITLVEVGMQKDRKGTSDVYNLWKFTREDIED